MRTDALDFHLPPERIAVAPASPRDAARLMVIHRDTGTIDHRHVRDLPDLGILRPHDLMVLNHTRVIPGRFTGTRRGTGGRVTGLLLSHDGRAWTVLLGSRGRLQPGEVIELTGEASLELVSPATGRGQWIVTLVGDRDTPAVLAAVGRPPLPPYILAERKRRGLPVDHPDDSTRYATTFSDESQAASAAAPTAGLHLTPDLLQQLTTRGIRRAAVTLEIGLGTFEPVRTDTLDDHPIHRERLHVPSETIDALRDTHDAKGRVLAIGTTTVRALESLPHPLYSEGGGGFRGDTDLFITPDRVASGEFTWRHTDLLLTNFHLPRSTLLAMVAALPGVGLDRLLNWYRTAIAAEYRFYSFGDAMLFI